MQAQSESTCGGSRNNPTVNVPDGAILSSSYTVSQIQASHTQQARSPVQGLDMEGNKKKVSKSLKMSLV